MQAGKTTCVGLSIPQGGGKTTVAGCLQACLKQHKIAVVSYDDFYLTRKE